MGATCSRADRLPAAASGAGSSEAPLSPQAMAQELEALQQQHDRTQEALRMALVTFASNCSPGTSRSVSLSTSPGQTSRNLSRSPSRSRNAGSRGLSRGPSRQSNSMRRRHSDGPVISCDEVASFNNWFQSDDPYAVMTSTMNERSTLTCLPDRDDVARMPSSMDVSAGSVGAPALLRRSSHSGRDVKGAPPFSSASASTMKARGSIGLDALCDSYADEQYDASGHEYSSGSSDGEMSDKEDVTSTSSMPTSPTAARRRHTVPPLLPSMVELREEDEVEAAAEGDVEPAASAASGANVVTEQASATAVGSSADAGPDAGVSADTDAAGERDGGKSTQTRDDIPEQSVEANVKLSARKRASSPGHSQPVPANTVGDASAGAGAGSGALHHLLLHHDNASEFRPTTTVAAYRTNDPIVFTKSWGTSVAKSGDYVVVGGEGDLFAMDSDTFARTYELVEGTGDDSDRMVGRVGQAGYGLGATISSPAMHARYRPRGAVLARRMSRPFVAMPTSRLRRTPELAGAEAASVSADAHSNTSLSVKAHGRHRTSGVACDAGMYLVQDMMGQQWPCTVDEFRRSFTTTGHTALLSVLAGVWVDTHDAEAPRPGGMRRVRSASSASARRRRSGSPPLEAPAADLATPNTGTATTSSASAAAPAADDGDAIRGRAHSMPFEWTEAGAVRRASSLSIGASLGSASGTQRSQIGAGVGGTSPGLGLVEGVEVDAHEWAKSLRATLQKEVDGEWDFDVFELTQVTLGRPLLHAGMHVFRRNGLLGVCPSGATLPSPGTASLSAAAAAAAASITVREETLAQFLSVVERTYLPNPYHNSTHAADVLITSQQLLRGSGLGQTLTPLEILSLAVSCVVHDVGHPGTSNAFQVNSRAPVALRYNDMSVLENFHCATAFQIMAGAGVAAGARCNCNVLGELTASRRDEARKLIIELVLATDLVKHRPILEDLKTRQAAGLSPESLVGTGEAPTRDRLLLLTLTIKCADLNHPAKSTETHVRWTALMMQEFSDQLQKERKLGLPISMNVDSDPPAIAQSQMGFIKFVIEPLYTSYTNFFRRKAGSASGTADVSADSTADDLAKPTLPWDGRVSANLEAWKQDAASTDHPLGRKCRPRRAARRASKRTRRARSKSQELKDVTESKTSRARAITELPPTPPLNRSHRSASADANALGGRALSRCGTMPASMASATTVPPVQDLRKHLSADSHVTSKT